MKKLLTLSLLALGACQGSQSAETPCPDIVGQGEIMVGNQMRHYYAVPHFDSKSKPCWQKLRAFTKSEDAPLGLSSGAHLFVFVDSTSFLAPTNGILTPEFGHHIIAQELLNKEAGIDEFSPDALEYGRYKEPQ